MSKKFWAAALLGAAAAGVAYAGRKISQSVKQMEEEINGSEGSHKAFVKKNGRDIILPEGEKFTGGAVGAALGSLHYDMSRVEIEDGSELSVEAYMGGVNVTVPPDVQVVLDAEESHMAETCVDMPEGAEDGPVLRIKARGTLGGIYIGTPWEEEDDGWDGCGSGEEKDWSGCASDCHTPDPSAERPVPLCSMESPDGVFEKPDDTDPGIQNAKSFTSAEGIVGVGLLEHDVPCCGPEAVVASHPAGGLENSALPEEEDEAALDEVSAVEEAAEDPETSASL